MAPAPKLHFDPAREESELRRYLGADFELSRFQHSASEIDREFHQTGSDAEFYRTSQVYLYDLTMFAMSRTKLPYLRELVRRIPRGARVLDYGCGIGSDGLILLEAGFRVEFADFVNPSTTFLRWRLAQRGLDAPVHDLDTTVPGGFDAAYAFDVIEHVRDPFAFLDEMERRARLVEVNFLAPAPDETPLHYPLPIAALLSHAAARRLLSYRRHYGRSHLVVYEPRLVSPLRRALNQARVSFGSWRG